MAGEGLISSCTRANVDTTVRATSHFFTSSLAVGALFCKRQLRPVYEHWSLGRLLSFMDFNTINSPLRFQRPIILSPPPLDASSQQQAALRQHLVGFNLQQEFEALNENLDLDLKENDGLEPPLADAAPPTALTATALAATLVPLTKLGSAPQPPASKLMAPSLKYGFSQDLLGLMLNPLASFSQSQALFDRPQLVNEFPALAQAATALTPSLAQAHHPGGGGLSFYPDLIAFTSWIESLAPQESLKMVDFLCNNLPIDILLTFKLTLDVHLTLYHHGAPQLGYSLPYGNQDLYSDFDAMLLALPLLQKAPLHQPKPKPNFRSQYLFADVAKNRPKLADPLIAPHTPQAGQPPLLLSLGQMSSQQMPMASLVNPLDRARSPTLHLFEKTNFLQLAAANPTLPMTGYHSMLSSAINPQSPQAPPAQTDDDLSAHTALKLGALATINLRVALDLNRKQQGHQYYRQGFEDTINRTANSLLVPLMMQRLAAPGMKTPIKLPMAMGKKLSPDHNKRPPVPVLLSALAALNLLMPLEVTNLELLSNIPAWLKLLRLHKYTDCLKDVPWEELIELDNDDLEAKGVIALGARRKLLKAFDVVKKAHSL